MRSFSLPGSLQQKIDGLYEIHKEDSYISAGDIEWQSNARYEEWVMDGGTFLSMLWKGIAKKTHLRSFMVIGGLWETNLVERLSLELQNFGSPSTRGWKAFHARPPT